MNVYLSSAGILNVLPAPAVEDPGLGDEEKSGAIGLEVESWESINPMLKIDALVVVDSVVFPS